MAEHTQFTVDSGVQVYFCDPRSPWQRGTNENTNGLLRQYLSKGASASSIRQPPLPRHKDPERCPEPVSEINVAQPALSQGSATLPIPATDRHIVTAQRRSRTEAAWCQIAPRTA